MIPVVKLVRSGNLTDFRALKGLYDPLLAYIFQVILGLHSKNIGLFCSIFINMLTRSSIYDIYGYEKVYM